ncbi:hypothetical protein MRB53_041193 [Persea americana]|nr:hypothetical protein MRB53_041193 [Persea americana]
MIIQTRLLCITKHAKTTLEYPTCSSMNSTSSWSSNSTNDRRYRYGPTPALDLGLSSNGTTTIHPPAFSHQVIISVAYRSTLGFVPSHRLCAATKFGYRLP